MVDKSVKSYGVCEFEITESNNRKLMALIVYAQMLDRIVSINSEEGTERLNIDGIINELLDDALERRIKTLKARHGFESESEFVELMVACNGTNPIVVGAQALDVVRNSERLLYKKMHRKILEQIPVEDRQMSFEFVDDKKTGGRK